MAGQFQIHPVQIAHLRKTAIKQLDDLFVDGRKKKTLDAGADREALCEEVGRLKNCARPHQLRHSAREPVRLSGSGTRPGVGIKDGGRGCTLSHLGHQYLTRPKSFHLRLRTN